MRKWIIVVAAFAAVAITATVSADTGPGDQGRRLAGPFCIDKSDGTVHSIPLSQACKPDQNRKLGVAVPCKSVTIKKVPVNPCLPAKGEKGEKGSTGAAGAAGPKGETGSSGSQGAVGPVGATGATGASGATGANGPKGDPGATGATGPAGPKGEEGGGLGNGTIVACVSQGGSVQFNVNGQPCDNPGHTQLELVVVNPS